MSPILTYALDRAKDVLSLLGIGGILMSAYTVSGLPVPATVHQVDIRVAAAVTELKAPIGVMSGEIRNLKVASLEGERANLRPVRAFLRNELNTLRRLVEAAPEATKLPLQRRQSEIEDEIRDLHTRDDELRRRIDALRS